MLKLITSFAVVLLASPFTHGASAILFPGPPAGKAASKRSGETFILENALISARWSLENGRLTGPGATDLASGETLNHGDDLFAIALEPQQVDADWVYLGLSVSGQEATAMVSLDGRNWNPVGKAAVPTTFQPKLLRVGKTDTKGGDQDYPDAGKVGTSEFLEVLAKDTSDKTAVLTGKPTRIHQSAREGTRLAIHNERGTITAGANSAAFGEYALPAHTRFVSCRIRKGDDQGMSWGPGLSLRSDDGAFVSLGVRAKDSYNLISAAGEQVIPFKANAGLNCSLRSSDFTSDGIKILSENGRQMLRATLVHPKHGLQVAWQAELRDDSNYIRQEFILTGTRPLEIHGLQLLDLKTANARQVGQVPGSPVATHSFFTGVEMPVTSNFINGDGFRSGFGCFLPVDPSTRYRFGSVIGTYPPGQLRRAFQYYLERERATTSSQFLHYNNWYDFRPSEKAFLEVIEAYQKYLTKTHGITLDSFVMDDGWDNFNEGLWSFDKTHFANGFSKVAPAARKAGSNLGVWISPLGGYGGCDQRTDHARKMGLIKDKLDLSQPGYYQWYRDKCLEMIRKYQVNYFKWDKAGSGVDPHFMALLRIASELKAVKPDLYLNVTVGTWPSPFWLNHIDCTWRDGSGDVAWHGPGDKRESWLTYRDMSCYRLCVQRAPLYPINSLMHHGLVIGHHYQGKDVATAGADLKNETRSYFGLGPNLQELYLSPDLMTPQAWAQVAEGIHWSKANKDVLVDAHWIGGDPGKLEVYGCAAWRGDRGTLMLRNPSDKPQTISLDIAQAFELPAKAATRWQLTHAYKDQPGTAPEMMAGQAVSFSLQPFEVLVFDAKSR